MIRILLVDDHPFVRHGIRAELEKASDMKIIGEAESGDDALTCARTLKPDIVILDISMPGKNGLEVLTQLRIELPMIKVLILSTFSEKQYALRSFKNGASGYLTKNSASEELLKAIRKIMSGGKYVTASMAEILAFDAGAKSSTLPHDALSDREFQVLCHLGAGNTVSQVAEILSLSLSTINTHRAHILQKMKLSNNAQIIRYVLDNNLLDGSR